MVFDLGCWVKMYLFIRHAEKSHRNGHPISAVSNSETREYSYDPTITSNGATAAKHLGAILVEKYGRPTKVIISPYLRARQTALQMLTCLPIELRPEPQVDTRLSEYLGHHRGKQIDLHPLTIAYRPPCDESFENLEERVRNYASTLQIDPQDRVWVVTHGLVIKLLAKHFHCSDHKRPYHLGFLDGILVENNNGNRHCHKLS